MMELLQEKLGEEYPLVVPDKILIDFKEAIIFSFLGMLRIYNIPNVLSSYTRSRRNNIGGALYGDFSKFCQKKA
jgi:anhydro-N-acetylmuramic acid kinase